MATGVGQNVGDGELYRLRCTLLGHSMDVRAVATGITADGKEFLVSGSRDQSTKIWMPSEVDSGFLQSQSCEGHTKYVACVHTIPPNAKHPSGLILSGGHDHTLLAYEVGNHHPIFRLIGHKGTVCSIDGTSDALIVSGSWDCSAKVWEEQSCVATLTGHSAAVWSVVTVPGTVGEHRILTGSADKEIRLWVNYTSARVYSGHTDCVRALAVVDSATFLSGSNDASIRLWNVESGATLQTFYGHSNFIYSLAVLPGSSGFISVSEDRTLRIWRGSETTQVIFHPALSVWTVAALANGDVVTGSSDGSLRVFSQSVERQGSPQVLASWEEEVAKSVVAAQQELGGMKISELPGQESLLIPGRSDGETKMVREGDKVSCYSWSAGDKKWSKVGDVVGASGATQASSGRVLHEGKEYDYVFNVDLDGTKALKLPYNVTEDPWMTAQKWIHKNELPQSYLEQVANFIVDNAKGIQIGSGTESGNDYADPFTGGARYVPGSGGGQAQFSNGGGGGLDPFTGSGAYTTGTQRASTGSSSATELNNSESGPAFPMSDFVKFTAPPPNFDGLKKKLVEFMKELDGGEEMADALLDMGRNGEWNTALEEIVRGALLSWPADKIFPILDLLRLGVGLKDSFARSLNTSLNVVTEFCGKFMSKDNPTNQMLSLRLLSNAFGPLTDQLLRDRTLVVSTLLNNLTSGKNNEIAAASLILNYSIVTSGLSSVNSKDDTKWATGESRTEVMMTAVQMLEQIKEPEAIFRLLVSIGNLVHGNSELASLFGNLDGIQIIQSFKNVTSAILPKVKNVCEQIQVCVAEGAPGPSSSRKLQ